MSGFICVNLLDMLEQLGEDTVKSILSSFSCQLNEDVEYFLKHTAITFARQQIAMTHLVFASYKKENVLVGYYTLASKYITLSKDVLSSRLRSRVTKFGQYNSETKRYLVTAPLIAQLGKNYYKGYNKLITGDELLKMACDKVAQAQMVIGGKVVYLECEDVPKLKDFYEQNGFVSFGKRYLDKDELRLKGEYLIQLLKYIK